MCGFLVFFLQKKTRRSHGFCSWNPYETLAAEWCVGFWDVGSWCQPDTYAYSLTIFWGIFWDANLENKLIPEADFLFFPHLLEATQILKITKWNPSWSSYHPGWGKRSGQGKFSSQPGILLVGIAIQPFPTLMALRMKLTQKKCKEGTDKWPN